MTKHSFIRGFGHGDFRDKRLAPNNKNAIRDDDLFRRPIVFDKRQNVRRRDPIIKKFQPPTRAARTPSAPSFETAYSGDGYEASPQGPWQISAMALLCIMGLLLALFLHLITDASPTEKVSYRRSPKTKKKKKTDEWSEDEAPSGTSYNADSESHPLYYSYQPRYPQQQHRHRKISGSGHHEITSGQSPVIINSRPFFHHNVSGSNSFPAPSSRSPVAPSRSTLGHGLEGFGNSTERQNVSRKPQPLSPVSSFASLSQNEHTTEEELSCTPEKVMELPPPYQFSSSSLFLSPGHEDFITPKAGPRRRVAMPLQNQSGEQIDTAVPFSGIAPLPFIPNLEQGVHTESPTNAPLPRSMEDTQIHRMESGDVTTESEGDSEPSPFRAYPGHFRKSESAPEQFLMTPPNHRSAFSHNNDNNNALMEANAVTPGPRHNIVHKRSDLREETDATRSLQSSINFQELTLQQVIGGGGFGQVWKATWRGTPVAVKVLTGSAQAEHASSPLLQEFAAEINLVKGMRHPNICLYMGACLDPPNRAIVTELAANGSLWDALRLPLQPPFCSCDGVDKQDWNTDGVPPAGTWPWALVKKVACGAARGMTYLHSGTPPVLHRDLKSANLLLDDSYTTKVCDFGLSRIKAQHNSMTGNCGTVQWMAPEVLANQNYAEPADVYSFGIILWELLTRECPYEGQSAIQCALAVLNKDYRPPIPDWCPADLAALIRACVHKNPSQRPTFAQIILALDAMA